jgi:hypothetical protein
MTQAVAHMTLYGGRLLLVYNRVLYPYHKWLMYELRHTEKKPANFIELMEQLLAQPSKEHAQAFCDCLRTSAALGKPFIIPCPHHNAQGAMGGTEL